MKNLKALIMIVLMTSILSVCSVACAENSVSESMAWLDSLVGQTVGSGQCVALIQSYYQHLGAATVSGNACDYASNALPTGWERVKGGVPEAGDILVYQGATYGHVAIYAGGTVSYHQNMAGKYVEKKTSWAYNNSWWSSAEGGQKYYWGYIRPNWSVSTHTEDPAYASLKGIKVTATKEILVHEGNHAYYDRSTRRIDAGDECTIEAIYTDGCCRVTYPSSSAPGGYRTLYAKKSDFNLPNPSPDVPGKERVLPDGDYIIATACSTNKGELYYLDIYGSEASATSGTNVHLHGPVSGTGDIAAYDAWTISYSGGFYTIKQKNANIALDVANASTASGANIQACVVNGSDAQKWVITKNGANGYRLQAKCSGLSLDAAGAAAASGTNVQQHTNNDTAAQGWLFIPYKPSQPIAEGRYVLLSAVDNSLELDVPGDTGNVADQTKLQIWKDTCPSKYNSFDVKKLSNGYYKLIHRASGKAMEIYGGGASIETSASLFTDNGSIAQQWAIVSNGSSGYMLKVRSSGLCLDLANAAKDNGSKVRQCWWNGSAAETWRFVPAEYTVSYNANGGTGAPGSQIKYYREDLTLSATKPTLNGYTFLGWSANKSATVADYLAGGKYYKEENVTLYAVWAANKYGFDINVLVDGVLEKSPTSSIFVCDFYLNGILTKANASDIADSFAFGTTYEIKNIRPTAPYVYDGIAVGALSGKIPASSTEVRLRFKTGSYVVTYDANTGGDAVTNMPANQTKTREVDLTLSEKIPVREGYTFLAWGKDSESGSWIYPGTVYRENAALKLVAIWGKDGAEMQTGEGRSYPDGDYIIRTTLNTDYFLDIAGGQEASEGANVQLYRWEDNSVPDYDTWTLTYLDNGFYAIKQRGTNMALTVADGSVKYRGNIQVNAYDGRTSQQWSISRAYTGSVQKGMRISSRRSGFSIDIQGAAVKNGSNIHQWEAQTNGNQSWIFEPYEPEHTLEDGRYILISNLEDDLELDVAGDNGDITDIANVQIWNDSGDDYAEGALSQYNAFDVEYIGEGYYRLIHKASGKALTVLEDSTGFNKNVVVSANSGALGQQWAILQEEGVYILLARCSGYALEVQNANTENGANVDQYRYINTPNKQWRFVPAEYTVKYSANGGSGAPEAQLKYYKGNLTLSDAVPGREDYVFTGWNTKANGSGTAYAPGDVYRVDEAVTLYAQWRRLNVLKLPGGIKAIEEQAFAGVAAEVIVIPDGCTSIGSEAFLDCKALVKLYIPASVNQITFDAFDGCDSLVIYAPEESTAIKLAKRLSIAYVITE